MKTDALAGHTGSSTKENGSFLATRDRFRTKIWGKSSVNDLRVRSFPWAVQQRGQDHSTLHGLWYGSGQAGQRFSSKAVGHAGIQSDREVCRQSRRAQEMDRRVDGCREESCISKARSGLGQREL